MKWSNLKNNKCPNCNKSLVLATVENGALYCKCGFKISEKRMKEIVTSQIIRGVNEEKHYRPEDENPDF